MKENILQQINQGLEQYRLEVQNKELLTQIDVAEKTIANQNQHIVNLYSNMNSLITIFGLIFAIFGIIIPLIMTALSIKNKNELKEIKDNVDDFITNKFKQWENQDIDKALDRYLSEEIPWQAYHTILKWQLMPYKHMEKIFNFAKVRGDASPEFFYQQISGLVYYLFVSYKDDKNEDFDKIRKLIIDCKYFYTLCLKENSIYSDIIQNLAEDEKKEKLSDLLNQSDNIPLSAAFRVIFTGDLLDYVDKNLMVEKLINRKDWKALRYASNNQEIVDKLFEANVFEKTNIWPPTKTEMQITTWGVHMHVDTNSYLAEKLRSEKDYFGTN